MPELGTIRHEGMGGFLCPPTHPMHEWSVGSRKGDTFSMCLETAANDSPWLDEHSRRRAKELLESWQRPPIESELIQAWIRQVLGYFQNCYKGEDGPRAWHAGQLRIDRNADPMLNIDLHAGVHLIRQYYPDFTPTKEQFEQARWGA